MYDREIVLDLLKNMIGATEKILYRNRDIKSIDDYLVDDSSLMLLDSLCMQLIAIGEAVKKIDKETDKKLFKVYSQIPWREVAGMRDILSHHYFDLNAEIIYNLCQEHIKDLNSTLKQIHNELKL